MSGIAESGTTNTQSVLMKNIIDRNTLVWWALMLASVLIGMTITLWGYLFWLTICMTTPRGVDAIWVLICS
jgi:hypothetical protein